MNETAKSEQIAVTIGSLQLGLPKGTLPDLDAVVDQLPREQLALRTVAVLTGLFADLDAEMLNVSKSLAGGLAGEQGAAIAKALEKPNALFVEPMQQLVLLRRCLTRSGESVVYAKPPFAGPRQDRPHQLPSCTPRGRVRRPPQRSPRSNPHSAAPEQRFRPTRF